ncbi:hypothetical protein CXG81DRAFT_12762 [Caulochytrium protostelioides]|uniref:Uncharacterized protein n=1 Tax=Caulochytrium protostelioides TaxID=1555241 RepID=A0A4P9X6M5_9FUNG|nr:hypothetical protein CXG81DRAFT_12762 [Caulochytrium protostelioides]|eukprot:RKP00846.1 hypothetical protein CXG81DRAFT_12762 [Caulochytrium protostelioides]
MDLWIPWIFCIQCGSQVRNPCHVACVGPTLGALSCLVGALVCWPTGACVYCCNHQRGRDMMGRPVEMNSEVTNAIPF